MITLLAPFAAAAHPYLIRGAPSGRGCYYGQGSW